MSRRDPDAPRENPWAKLVTGTAILAVGVIFWLDQTDRIDASEVLRWWPLVLIGWGLASLPERRFVAAAVLIVLGVLFLPSVPFLPDLHVVQILALWPLLITAAGVTLLAQALRPATKDLSRERGFRAVAVMAGNSRRIASDRFAGGDAVAVMGGCDIDLTGATPTADAVIDVLAFWGGIEIKVPRGWRIENRVLPLLGAFSDSTNPAVGADAPRLVVRGSVIMGAIEVKNSKQELA